MRGDDDDSLCRSWEEEKSTLQAQITALQITALQLEASGPPSSRRQRGGDGRHGGTGTDSASEAGSNEQELASLQAQLTEAMEKEVRRERNLG